MNPDNNIKRNFLCWLIGHRKGMVCKRCWALIDFTFFDEYMDVLAPERLAQIKSKEKQ